MERCKLEGKDDSCVRLCRAKGLGWEIIATVRPYLLGKGRGRVLGKGKQAVGSLRDYP